MKTCPHCRENKAPDQYYKSSRWCKDCMKAHSKKQSATKQEYVRIAVANPVEQQAIDYLQSKGIIVFPGINSIDLLAYGIVRIEVKDYIADYRVNGEAWRYTFTPKQQERLLGDVIMLKSPLGWSLLDNTYHGFYLPDGRLKTGVVFYGDNVGDLEQSLDQVELIYRKLKEFEQKVKCGEFDDKAHFNK